MSPRSEPARRTVLLSAAGVTVLAGLAWLPDPSRTRSISLAAEPAVPATALARRVSTAPVTPARTGTHLVTVRASRSGRAVHPGVEHSISATGRELVLSIDDGPSPDYTPEVLAILRRYDVKATFCMVGRNVAAYPEVAKAVAAEGHQLANHTWSHAWLPDLSHRAMVREIERAQLTLDHVTHGFAPTVFRAPFGAWSPAILELCWRNRMRALGWSIDPKDWARPPAHQIVSNVLSNAAPGRIILDHDGGGDRSHTVAAIRAYLPRLLRLGYRFVLP
jgi:peptidoglycan/xylan/chitin deacetylase (PgdA/CDA1 family)